MHRVLVVDSDMAAQAFFAGALDAASFRLHMARNGAEALRLFARFDFDVVVTETQLPDMPGWMLVPQIRRLAPRVPVIAISADDSWHLTRRMRIEAGPLFFFGIKPLNRSEMLHAIQAAAAWRFRHADDAGSMGAVSGGLRRRY